MIMQIVFVMLILTLLAASIGLMVYGFYSARRFRRKGG